MEEPDLGEGGVNIRYSYRGSGGSARRVNACFGVSDLMFRRLGLKGCPESRTLALKERRR